MTTFINNYCLPRSFEATAIEGRKKVSVRHKMRNVKECEDPTQKLSEDRQNYGEWGLMEQEQ